MCAVVFERNNKGLMKEREKRTETEQKKTKLVFLLRIRILQFFSPFISDAKVAQTSASGSFIMVRSTDLHYGSKTGGQYDFFERN